MENLVNYTNMLFQNDTLRTTLLIMTSVFIGYTLQPVPKWLNNLFDTSHVFKFIIMMIVGITALYPLDATKLINIIIGSIIVLVLFEASRKYDSKLNK